MKKKLIDCMHDRTRFPSDWLLVFTNDREYFPYFSLFRTTTVLALLSSTLVTLSLVVRYFSFFFFVNVVVSRSLFHYNDFQLCCFELVFKSVSRHTFHYFDYLNMVQYDAATLLALNAFQLMPMVCVVFSSQHFRAENRVLF